MVGSPEGGEPSIARVWLLLLSGARPHVAPSAIKSSTRDPREMQCLVGAWVITLAKLLSHITGRADCRCPSSLGAIKAGSRNLKPISRVKGSVIYNFSH